MRSGGPEVGGKVRSARLSWLLVAASLPGVAAAPEEGAVTRRFEVRVETVANRKVGPVESCEVVQARSAGTPLTYAAWSTLGEAVRCGAGAFAGSAEASSGAAPVLIEEVTAVVGWDSGAMDPGPVGAAQVFVTLTTRQLTGHT